MSQVRLSFNKLYVNIILTPRSQGVEEDKIRKTYEARKWIMNEIRSQSASSPALPHLTQLAKIAAKDICELVKNYVFVHPEVIEKAIEIRDFAKKSIESTGVKIYKTDIDSFDTDYISEEMLFNVNTAINNKYGIILVRENKK